MWNLRLRQVWSYGGRSSIGRRVRDINDTVALYTEAGVAEMCRNSIVIDDDYLRGLIQRGMYLIKVQQTETTLVGRTVYKSIKKTNEVYFDIYDMHCRVLDLRQRNIPHKWILLSNISQIDDY